MREINEIIIHCSDTKTNQDFSIEDIRKWHTSAPRNWSDIGYHYYIKLDGSVWYGRPLEKAGAHVKGRNKNTIGVCFEGGRKDTARLIKDCEPWDGPTEEQIFNYKENVLKPLNSLFGELPVNPHSKYSDKGCPFFDLELLK